MAILLDLNGRANPRWEKLIVVDNLLAKCRLEFCVVSCVGDVVWIEFYWFDILKLLLCFTLFPLTGLLAKIRDNSRFWTLSAPLYFQ